MKSRSRRLLVILVWLGTIWSACRADVLAPPRTVPYVNTYWQPAMGMWSSPENWSAGLPADNYLLIACVDNGGVALLDTAEYASGLRIGVASESAGGTVQILSGGSLYCHTLPIGVLGYGILNHPTGIVKVQGLYMTYRGEEYYWGGHMGLDGTGGQYNLGGDGALEVQSGEVIGITGTGTFNQSGGSNTVPMLHVGMAATGVGAYNLTGGTLAVSDHECIGSEGTGTFTQSGGTNQTGKLYVGYQNSSTGIYNLSGTGVLSAEYIYVAYWSHHGSFLQTDGIATVSQDLHVGAYRRSVDPEAVYGEYKLQGGQLSALNEHIGYSGTDLRARMISGRFVQSGGTNQISQSLNVGYGYNSLDTSTYELLDGSLDVKVSESVGYHGIGQFIQTGGRHTAQLLTLGGHVEGVGTYMLSGTGSLAAQTLVVGYLGNATFVQDAGANSSTSITIAQAGGIGRYELSGSGRVMSNSLVVGYGGQASFVQTGGTVWASNLQVGFGGNQISLYELSDGELIAQAATLGFNQGRARFVQRGGKHRVSSLILGSGGNESVYWLGAGELTVTQQETVGSGSSGDFIQEGGTHAVATLYMGWRSGVEGEYRLVDGSLSSTTAMVGGSGIGRFTQTGGRHQTGTLEIGGLRGGEGIYGISGGALEVRDLLVGGLGRGTLSIDSPEAQVTVTNHLEFGPDSVLVAVPGAQIHLPGTDVLFSTTDLAGLAGLENLELVFEGGPDVLDTLEVLGQPGGSLALGGITLGGRAVGRLRLVDMVDNHPGWDGPECLQVKNLTLKDGAYLDLAGVDMHCWSISIAPGAMVDLSHGGSLILVPEPTMLGLEIFALWLLMLQPRRCA